MDNIQISNEMAFIGSLFVMDEDGYDVLLKASHAISIGTNESWFTDKRCRLVWKAVIETWGKGNRANVTTLDVIEMADKITHAPKSEFKGVVIDPSFVDESLKYMNTSKNLDSYATYLRKSVVERQIRDLCTEFTEKIKSNDVISVGNLMTQKMLKVLMQGSGSREVDLEKSMDDLIGQYRFAANEVQVKGNVNYTPGYPVPWPKLSRVYNGYNAGYHILAGRPSVGKTSFALQLIRYWCDHGVKVLFNCLDMSVYEFLKRPLSDISHVTTRKAMFGNADSEYDFPAMEKAAEHVKQWYRDGLLTLMEPEYDVNAFKAYCMMKKQLGQLDIVVVDFIQLMRYYGSERLPESQKVTYVSGILKSISNELRIPVLALSQLKRADRQNSNGVSEKGREPELDDLRSSGAIEQDAFTVTFLYQDDKTVKYWKEHKEDNDPHSSNMLFGNGLGNVAQPVWLNVKKNQNGDLGCLPFVVFKNTFSWYLGDYSYFGHEKGDPVPENVYMFSKVHDDWRHDKNEEIFSEHGVLISTEEEENRRIEEKRTRFQIKRFNENREDQIRAEESRRPKPFVAQPTVQEDFSSVPVAKADEPAHEPPAPVVEKTVPEPEPVPPEVEQDVDPEELTEEGGYQDETFHEEPDQGDFEPQEEPDDLDPSNLFPG